MFSELRDIYLHCLCINVFEEEGNYKIHNLTNTHENLVYVQLQRTNKKYGEKKRKM